MAGVAKAKGEIYTGLPENGIAIMNADNNDWLNWQSIIGDRLVWRFSPNAANSDFTAANIHVTSHGTEFTLQTPMGSIDVAAVAGAAQYCQRAGGRCFINGGGGYADGD